jgi:uncharacterized protein (DUF362 family)
LSLYAVGMANNDDSISRRKFLEQAGVAVGAVALGDACSSDDETGPSQPNSETAGTTGAAGQTSSGAGTGSTTTGGASGSAKAGTGGSSATTAGKGSAAAGSGASGTGGSPTSGKGGSGGSSPANGGAGNPSPAAGSGGTGTPGMGAPSGKISVGIVSRSNVDEAVAKAIELAGGLDDIKPGQTVFIKPNAVSDRAIGMAGIRTSPEVLAAVVKLVKAKNPGKIIVGDRSARQFPDTARVFSESGLGEAAMMAGADEIYAAKSPAEAPDEWMLQQPPMYETTWRAAGGIYAMKKILESDHLILVPTCKNHRYALYSLSMKLFMGAIGDSSRDPVHFSDSIAGEFTNIGKDLAIMNQMFHPTMVVIDALTALVNGGPQGDGSDAVRTTPGLIFASKDRLAIDAAAVSLIQLELDTATVPTPDASNATLKRDPVWKMPQIVQGIALGIGNGDPANIELKFDGVMRSAEIEAKFRKT